MTILAKMMIDVLEILHGLLVTPQLLTWLTRLQLSQLFSKIIFLLYHVVVILIVVDFNVIHVALCPIIRALPERNCPTDFRHDTHPPNVSSIVSLCKTFFYMLFIRKKVSNFNIVINKLHLRLIFFSSSSISSLIHIFSQPFFLSSIDCSLHSRLNSMVLARRRRKLLILDKPLSLSFLT
jgi:hypothetical protein